MARARPPVPALDEVVAQGQERPVVPSGAETLLEGQAPGLLATVPPRLVADALVVAGAGAGVEAGTRPRAGPVTATPGTVAVARPAKGTPDGDTDDVVALAAGEEGGDGRQATAGTAVRDTVAAWPVGLRPGRVGRPVEGLAG